MNILIVRTAGNIINTANYNSQEIGLAKALVDMGNTCDIVFFYGKNTTKAEVIKYNDKTITIFWEHGYSIAGNGLFPKLNRLLPNYDVIQMSEYDQLTSIYYMYYSPYKSKVVLYHGPYYSEFKKKYNKKCKVIDWIPVRKKIKSNIPCAAKSLLAKEFLMQKGYKNIVVTGVGLDVGKFDKRELIADSTQAIIDKLSDNHVLLYVGQISQGKNTVFLIEVLKKIVESHEDCILLIIGKGNDKQYFEKCRFLIKKYDLNNNILWVEGMPQSQLPYIYENADVFLLPTLYDIFGMVLMEAMYSRIPVITTMNGGSTTILKSGVNGFVEELDLNMWVMRIERLISDESYRNLIGSVARQEIIDNFMWKSVAERMINVYRERMC